MIRVSYKLPFMARTEKEFATVAEAFEFALWLDGYQDDEKQTIGALYEATEKTAEVLLGATKDTAKCLVNW